METVASPEALSTQTRAWRQAGLRIGFVPTMGFLHAGHTSLMDQARSRCDRLVASIFVNPLQFGPTEDLDTYPRAPEGDAAKCRAHGVDLLFIPERFYPSNFSTTVSVSGVSEGLCGGHRPGHFDGVTTVVARLFGLVRPHVAVFGEKDYQQLAVVRQLIRDLALDVEVVGAALVRDSDGLALSSRNATLTADQRERGLSLHRALQAMAAACGAGTHDVAVLLALGRGLLQADRLDYLEVRDAQELTPLTTIERPARALVAGFFGQTRLIDNLALVP
jgi:pantoate--beta-alanine ligase